ncbi:hypothetical protein HUS23_12650 [Ectothiorhodospiraceae bacterium 2226]|nr:hypothetical protein HUS23_12650 [Ectothiorhodospiraceae bacterium 2226]
MHPTIRVVAFLVFSVFVASAHPAALLLAAALVAALYLRTDLARGLAAAWRMLRRLRWLLLSILVLYGWFTPGTPLLPLQDVAGWLPTWQGVTEGGRRVAVLVLMVLAISHLLQHTSRAGLIAALRWLGTPLRPLGLDPDRLALRVVLVLETLSEVQDLVGKRVQALRAEGLSRAASARVAADVFAEVVRRAEAMAPQTVELPSDRPRPHEWLYPAALAAAFGAVLWLAP